MDLPRINPKLDVTFSISPGDTQVIWDNTDGVIDKFYLHPLGVQAAGELIYIGTSLHDLAGKDDDEDADYAISLRIMGTEDLQLDIIARRQDANNFIALKINFATDTIALVKTVAGVETNLHRVSHDFKFEGVVKYDFELQMIGTSLYGIVNGFNIVSASDVSFRTEPGLSILFPTFNADDPPRMYSISVVETEVFPDPTPPSNDPGGMLLFHRLDIKQQIENPSERTWDSYVKAQKYYIEQRDFGMSDNAWEQLGYPIRMPSAEEWFGDLP